MPKRIKHVIGRLGGENGGGGSSGNITLSQVNLLIKQHNENLSAHQNKVYEEDIITSKKIWSIQHNLNAEWFKLNIISIDSNGNYVIGEVDKVNSTNNLLVINFKESISGKVVIKK